MTTKKKPTAYRVKVGLDYPVKGVEKRAEKGDVVTDLPPKSIPWLLEGDYIELEES